jgi:hypothetical protein
MGIGNRESRIVKSEHRRLRSYGGDSAREKPPSLTAPPLVFSSIHQGIYMYFIHVLDTIFELEHAVRLLGMVRIISTSVISYLIRHGILLVA